MGREDREYAFVSYSRHDRAFVDRLVDDLSAAGVMVWLDTAQFRPGSDWLDAVVQALDNATAMLFVGSAHSTPPPATQPALSSV